MVLVESDTVRRAALYNVPPAFAALRTNKVWPVHPRSAMDAAIRSKQVVQVEDLRSSSAYLERARSRSNWWNLQPRVRLSSSHVARRGGDRPDHGLSSGGTSFQRQADRPVDQFRQAGRDRHRKRAIVRELRQRTDDLSEALVFQTGSSNILKVIASSPSDVGPALKAIVDSAREICEAYDAAVLLKDGRDLLVSAHHGPIPLASRKRRSTGIGSPAAP